MHGDVKPQTGLLEQIKEGKELKVTMLYKKWLFLIHPPFLYKVKGGKNSTFCTLFFFELKRKNIWTLLYHLKCAFSFTSPFFLWQSLYWQIAWHGFSVAWKGLLMICSKKVFYVYLRNLVFREYHNSTLFILLPLLFY